MIRDYTHELNREVRSISGGYSFDTEMTVELHGRKVLVAVGNAVVDGACCGFYGCRFALVAGYIKSWKYRTNEEGTPVSRVETIEDTEERKRIATEILRDAAVTQVQFL